MPTPKRRPGHQAASPAADAFPVVGIGASAGGLEACRNFIRALPPKTGMAFVLIQHLDPTHESVMGDLLASHTFLAVQQASNGMAVEREHLYVIPPGFYLAIADGKLVLSEPLERHGARLPVDFFLRSLADECGAHAIAIVLSGTGADGSLGVQAVNANDGLVLVQDPNEATYDGMPRSAMRTGAVDFVLATTAMPEALLRPNGPPAADAMPSDRHLANIVDYLRTNTAHDFTLYKQGTLQRRIERRIVLAGIPTDDTERYLAVLKKDPAEVELLVKDLLINVTSFFRDPAVFEHLAKEVIPELVNARQGDDPIRIWIAGCSTGEETYSLVMLFREYMAATNRRIKLLFFASDVDADAIATARDGLYPDTIAAEVSPARLARFFTKEGNGYRVVPDLRAAVVFTVQDLLIDPPFSRLDMISCRNLLIYLLPEAQARVFGLFHFAMRKDGILLLGNSETVGDGDDRFEAISKTDRVYRHVGRHRPGEHRFSINPRDAIRQPSRSGQSVALSRQMVLAELCRRLVIETHAPAAILINSRNECLYSVGPTSRFVHVPMGHPTTDLFAMVLPALRTRLRLAIQRALHEGTRVTVDGGMDSDNPVTIDVQPALSDGEELLLICFLDAPKPAAGAQRSLQAQAGPLDVELERELEATRAELQAAIHDLEISGEEQKAINDEASSLNEELQSTNEELMTSKEELQSINEETAALNTQLHEGLERQRTTSNDLQNVLNSTNVATIFLDVDLHIRFFTPATRALFNVIPGDIGRSLFDLKALSVDRALQPDARAVLTDGGTVEREIETQSGTWYVRRVLPYRTEDGVIEGVVITFVDSTDRRRIADALETARREAEQASIAKSRFLAAASHDLRQPLQSLVLMRDVLAKKIKEGKTAEALDLLARVDETSAAMSAMLNSLLDITQIDGGAITAQLTDFPIDEILQNLTAEFGHVARSQGLVLRTVACGCTVTSDRHLLAQMVRNLLANALKYTRHGKILLGCRRQRGMLSVEVWDTGVGIPEHELVAIFDEYHQIGNGTHARNRGLGLGLSIVQRLGKLLDHPVRVRSTIGKGSVFSIEIKLSSPTVRLARTATSGAMHNGAAVNLLATGTILVVEDDPEVRELLDVLLRGEGHYITIAEDGVAALALLAGGMIRPDLLLADFNLPHAMTGLQLAVKLREKLRRDIPVIILTGDISADTMRDITRNNCIKLNKPVQVDELIQAIQHLLPNMPTAEPARAATAAAGPATIYVVDDDPGICDAMRLVFEDNGQLVEIFSTAEAFLAAYHPGREACVLVDAYLPGISGLALLTRLRATGHHLPAIMITGNSDVQMVVDAMKAGAVDFIEKPVGREELIASVGRALELARDAGKSVAWQEEAAGHIAHLTSRQREVMDMVLAGHPSKNIAYDLNISQRTVENHRAEIMKRTGAKSLPALARLAISAKPLG